MVNAIDFHHSFKCKKYLYIMEKKVLAHNFETMVDPKR